MYGWCVRSFVFAAALTTLLSLAAEARNPRQVIITRGQPTDPSDPDFIAAPIPRTDPTDLHLADFRQEALTKWSDPEVEPTDSLLAEPQADWQTGGSDAATSACGCEGCDCESGQCGSDLSGNDLCESDMCGNSCQAFGLAAGVEATFLKPTFQSSNPGLDPEFDNFQTEAAPRVWVQWQWPGRWGVRARYWDFDAEQNFTGASTTGETLGVQTFNDQLELYAIDLELTRNFNLGQWEMCGSFGARNGRFLRRQNLNLTIFDLEGGGGDDATAILLQNERDLTGTGITFALGMRRPFFNRRLSAILNLRGSAIGNSNEFEYRATGIEVVPVGAGDLDLADVREENLWNRNTKAMWIGEVQAGGEWRTPLSRDYGGGNAFVQVLFEGQWWNLPGVGTSEISTNDQLYQFVGVTCAAGFTR